jgi:hypothetical protein
MPHSEIEKSTDDEGSYEKGTGIPEGKTKIESSVELNPLL